jgi:hypothetical protein
MRTRWLRLALVCCSLGSAAVRAQPGACAPELLAADRRGSPSAISRQDDVLYLGAGAAVVVVDTGELTAPVERGRVDLDEMVLDVAHWQTTVVALGARGLSFVDAGDRDHPELAGSFDFPPAWIVRSVAARASHAFVPEAGGLRIVSFADPASPALVGFFPAASTRDVAVSGNRAYLLSAGVLRVINVSNPASPYLVASVPVGTGNDDRLSIAGSGNRLAAWGRWSSGHRNGSGAELFSLLDPALPVMRSSLFYDDWSFDSLAFAFDRVYVGGLVYDVSSLANPVLLGNLGLPTPVDAAIAPEPDFLFVASADIGLFVVDVTTPADPQVAASVPMPSEAQDGYLAGALAVLVRRGALETFDLTDPAHPAPLGRLPWPSSSFQEVERVGDHAWVATSSPENAIRIVDLSDPSQPEVVGAVGSYVWNAPARAGGVVGYVDECAEWLRLLDVADPGSPLPLGEIPLGGSCYKTDFAMTAERLYLWDFDDYDADARLRVFDLSDPALPVELGSAPVDPWHWARSVVHGRYLLLTDEDRFDVLDVADATDPVRVASLPLAPANWYERRLTLYGSRALVAPYREGYEDFDDRTYLLDVADPLVPAVVAELRPPGHGRAAFAGPGLILVADGPAGYSIYSSCVPFADGFESGDASEWSLAGR